MNNVEITPGMINCMGCRVDGVKTVYCDRLCAIRQCAMGRKNATCGDCAELELCQKVAIVVGNNAEALSNLKG